MLAETHGGGDGAGERRSRQGEEAGRPDGGGASKKSSSGSGKASSKASKKSHHCKKCPRLIALMHELKNHLQILKPKADQRDEYHQRLTASQQQLETVREENRKLRLQLQLRKPPSTLPTTPQLPTAAPLPTSVAAASKPTAPFRKPVALHTPLPSAAAAVARKHAGASVKKPSAAVVKFCALRNTGS
ncbi:unnamed protein product, partial [Laminaria digitata]